MSLTRHRAKGRADSGSFLRMPHAVMKSPNYLQLSAHACKLLYDLAVQYRGNNNGDLCAAWTLMERRGWRSRDTLGRSLKELRHYGLIELTRQGGLNRPNLYAITWQPIDDCGGKLDVPPSRVASGAWKSTVPPYERCPQEPGKLQDQHAERVDRHGGRVSESKQRPPSARQACRTS